MYPISIVLFVRAPASPPLGDLDSGRLAKFPGNDIFIKKPVLGTCCWFTQITQITQIIYQVTGQLKWAVKAVWMKTKSYHSKIKNGGGSDLFRHIRRASLPWISPVIPWRGHRRAPSSSTSSSSCSSFLNLSTSMTQNDAEIASYYSPTLSFRFQIWD